MAHKASSINQNGEGLARTQPTFLGANLFRKKNYFITSCIWIFIVGRLVDGGVGGVRMEETGAFGYWRRAVELAVKLLLIQAARTGIWNTRGCGGAEEKGKRPYQWTWRVNEGVKENGGTWKRKKDEKQIIRQRRIELKGDRRREWLKKEKEIIRQHRRGAKRDKVEQD